MKGEKIILAAKINDINAYTHPEADRPNILPSELAIHEHIPDDVHSYTFDPNMSPALEWAGKSEGTSFEVPVQSIHQYEKITPHRVIAPVLKDPSKAPNYQGLLFSDADPFTRIQEIGRAIEAYHYREAWTNRMIAGDSLVIMNSLLQKEGMAGSVQMCYIDPPHGIKYGSNFQAFTDKKDVKDKADEDLTTEPEMIRAFRDTWELGIHSYLKYLRNRLLLVKELLKDSGSVFVQISDENVHHVRELCDEVFGPENFVTMIKFQKTGSMMSNLIASTTDYLVWYAKDKKHVKYHKLYLERKAGDPSLDRYDYVELDNGTVRRVTPDELRDKRFLSSHRIFQYITLYSDGATSNSTEPVNFEGKDYYPPANKHWVTTIEGMKRLIAAGRVVKPEAHLRYKRYLNDFPVIEMSDIWQGMQIGVGLKFVVQTSPAVIQRCILMTSDPGDLVLDITCGSGTTAYVAEQWGRRWITCDTSRVALAIARQRLLTAIFPWYELADPERGPAGGFKYKTVPHITLKSIANNEPPASEILYDQPVIDSKRVRLSGPFTVEALPAPVVFSPDEAIETENINASARLSDWREQLKATGIIGRNGERIRFSRVEAVSGHRWISARAETDEENPRTAFICFANESSLMDSQRVNKAFEEAARFAPDLLIFAAFQFDPKAAELIAENSQFPEVKALQVQMNPDLMTDDLRRKIRTDQSFWLVGQPDAELVKTKSGKYKVRVLGFDYYNVKTNEIDAGDTKRIAMWMLDTNYSNTGFVPSQVFFPLEGKEGGWAKLENTLKTEIDPELKEAYSGTESLEFEAGEKVAVKIIDNRGIESMKILDAKGADEE